MLFANNGIGKQKSRPLLADGFDFIVSVCLNDRILFENFS